MQGQTPPIAPEGTGFLSGEELHSLGRAGALLVAAFGLSMLLIELGSARVLTYHETLFALPAREMLQTGDWIVPRFVGIPSTHKPPGTEWVQALSMALFQSDAEWVLRLPSVLAAVVQALILSALAARFFGRRVAILAGLAQLTMSYVLQLARLGEADMLLTASVTAAMAAFAVANVPSPLGVSTWRGWPVLFYLAATASYFFKGFMGPAVIFSGALAFVLTSQEPRRIRFLLHPLGLLLFVGPVVGWFAAAVHAYPRFWDDQVMHHFGRFRGDLGGAKDPFFYLWAIPLVLLPWTPLVAVGLVRGIRQGHYAQPFWRFAACWMGPVLALLAFATFKSKHYPVPLLPPLSIVAALGLLTYQRWRFLGRGPGVAITLGLTLGAAVVASGAVVWAAPRGTGAIVGLLWVITLGAVAAAVCEIRRHRLGYFAAIFGAAWCAAVGVQTWIMPLHDSHRDLAELAQRANGHVPAGEPVYLVALPENEIAFYLRQPLVRIDKTNAFLRAAVDQSIQYVVAPAREGEDFARLGTVETIDRSASLGRHMTEEDRLTLFRIERGSQRTATIDAARSR